MASDSYRQNDARRRYNAYARGDLHLDTRQDLTLVVNLLHQERYNFLYWVGLDRALVPPDAQQGDRITSTRYNISGQYRNVLADDLLLTARGMWFRNTFSSDVGASLDQSTSGVLRAEAQATWAFAPRHTLVAGIDGELTDVSSDIFSTRTGTGLAVYAQDEFRALDGPDGHRGAPLRPP